MAKFYDISSIINPDYENVGYITSQMAVGLTGRINSYVQKNPLNIGDILFVGSTSESRPEYGFCMILPARGSEAQGSEAQGSEYIIGMPLMPVILEILQKNKVNYTRLFKEMMEDKVFKYIFFPDDEDEVTDIITSYKQYSLLD